MTEEACPTRGSRSSLLRFAFARPEPHWSQSIRFRGRRGVTLVTLGLGEALQCNRLIKKRKPLSVTLVTTVTPFSALIRVCARVRAETERPLQALQRNIPLQSRERVFQFRQLKGRLPVTLGVTLELEALQPIKYWGFIHER